MKFLTAGILLTLLAIVSNGDVLTITNLSSMDQYANTTLNPAIVKVRIGEAIYFNCAAQWVKNANGDTGITWKTGYQWYKNGKKIGDNILTTGILSISSVSDSDVGIYYCSVTGAYYNKMENCMTPNGCPVWIGSQSIKLAIDKPTTLISPINGAGGQPLSTTFVWLNVNGATNYDVQVSTDSTFAGIKKDTIVIDTMLTLTGLKDSTKYFWRVNDTTSVTSSWTDIWNFTTTSKFPFAPVLLTPTNTAVGVAAKPTLTWGQAFCTDSYSVQVSTDSNFTSLVINQTGLTNLSFNVITGLTNNTNYFWRVNGANANGVGSWSPIWKFTTILAFPNQVVLTMPQNSSIINVDSIKLTWQTATPLVTKYHFQIATDSLMSFVFQDSAITDTTKVYKQLSIGQIYWWWVRAYNLAGWGPFSEKRSFKYLATKVISSQSKPCSFSCKISSKVLLYSLPFTCFVSIKYYDLRGRMLCSIENKTHESGSFSVSLPQIVNEHGTFLQVFQAGSFVKNDKIVNVH